MMDFMMPTPLLTFSDKTDFDDSNTRRKGRPRKDIDIVTIFHMLKNSAPIAAIAKHLGVHRDTIYSRYSHVIEEGREAYEEAWKEIQENVFWPRMRAREEKRRLSREELNAKYLREIARKKRAYRRARCRELFRMKYPD